MAIATGPKPQAIILLPDNGRRGARPTTVEVGLDGCQRGIVRLYTTEEVNGQRVPDYTLVLSREEERRHRHDRFAGTYLFHSQLIDPKNGTVRDIKEGA